MGRICPRPLVWCLTYLEDYFRDLEQNLQIWAAPLSDQVPERFLHVISSALEKQSADHTEYRKGAGRHRMTASGLC